MQWVGATIVDQVFIGWIALDGGLGGPIRFLLDDAGTDYEYHLIPWDDFVSKVKYQWIESGYPFDQAPMIEFKGKRYSGYMPIMRFLSKKLGKVAWVIAP